MIPVTGPSHTSCLDSHRQMKTYIKRAGILQEVTDILEGLIEPLAGQRVVAPRPKDGVGRRSLPCNRERIKRGEGASESRVLDDVRWLSEGKCVIESVEGDE